MLLYVSVALIALIVLWGIAAPASLGSASGAAFAFTSANFSWFYLWVVLGVVGFCLFVAFSRFGQIRLGRDREKPAYSTRSWFAMLFAAGMGIGLVFWGVAEPMSHYLSPPPGVEAGTPMAARVAMDYTFFHWGLHPWAIYSIVALSIAFTQFRLKGGMTIGATLGQLPGRPSAQSLWPVDLLAIVATVFGVATTLGLGAAQINGGLNAVFGVPLGTTSQIAIILVTTVAFMASMLTGLDRGIQFLSNTNLWVAAALALAIFVLGPTAVIMETLTTTLGDYISSFVQTSLRTTPYRDSSWVQDWTVFYWAWWVSWSPFVGLFIARISRGRTIREFILGALLAPTLACFAWFSIFGGTALHLDLFGGAQIGAAVQADTATALFALFEQFPLATVLSVVATLLIVIFFVTSGDSATFVLGIMSTGGNPNPSARVKAVWGILISGIAISLLLAGGLQAIQTAMMVAALPFTAVLGLMCVSLYRALNAEWERMHPDLPDEEASADVR